MDEGSRYRAHAIYADVLFGKEIRADGQVTHIGYEDKAFAKPIRLGVVEAQSGAAVAKTGSPDRSGGNAGRNRPEGLKKY